MKHGKKYLEAAKKVDNDSLYTFDDASKLVKEIAFAKFDRLKKLKKLVQHTLVTLI